MIISMDAEKNPSTKSSTVYDKNPEETKDRRNLSKHHKGYV